MNRGDGVVVSEVPLLDQILVDMHHRHEAVEFTGRNNEWKGYPPIPLSEQKDEVRSRADVAAALDLADAQRHGLLVALCLNTHAPSEIDHLEAGAMRLAHLPKPGKHVLLERVSLRHHILECGAYKNSESSTRLNHSVFPFSKLRIKSEGLFMGWPAEKCDFCLVEPNAGRCRPGAARITPAVGERPA